MLRLVVLLCALISLAVAWAAPVRAADSGTRQHEVGWSQRDTAVYVVSTLNLVRTSNGRAFVDAVTKQLSVTHFDVYADLDRDSLYFIQLKRADDSTAGVLAYQMGWLKPKSITASCRKLGVRQAAWSLMQAYRVDTKMFMASFTSTLPR